jgi:protein-tyrosine phosphatase
MFRHLVEKSGLENKYFVDSAGTSAWHVGEKPDPRMRRVASNHGLKYSGSGRQFQSQDFDKFDLIIAMDSTNFRNLSAMTERPEYKKKIHMMREFDPQGEDNASVPDPYYGGIDGFEDVFRIVERSCEGLLESLEKGKLE